MKPTKSVNALEPVSLQRTLEELYPARIPLRLIAEQIIWTDGSCIKPEDGNGPHRLGAAVYNGLTGDTTHVDPAGHEYTNTITRAELAAIRAAIATYMDTRSQLVTIATDSQASIHLIKRAVNDPAKLHISKHKAILGDIAELLYQCAHRKTRVQLIKVRSHTGLFGNDKADEGATAVARGDAKADLLETADNAPFDKLLWLKQKTTGRYVSDLNQGIMTKLPRETHAGYTNDTCLTEKWRDASAALDPRASNAYLVNSKTQHWTKLQILKARYGMLYNAKLKMLYGRGGDGRCPVCRKCHPNGPAMDSGAHILGGCAHPVMKGMYINRHNRATQIIANTIHKGESGGGLMIMDAGKAAELPPYCSGNRVPAWMLPHLGPEDIKKMRPDILFIPTLPTHTTRRRNRYRGPDDKSKHTVYIIEVGYTGDLQHAEKLAQKTTQHEQLAAELRKAGWEVRYSEAQIATLGATGTLPSTLKPLLRQLGATQEQALKACAQIHSHTVETVGSIVRTRRHLESKPG
jgi:ribonuclease HI